MLILGFLLADCSGGKCIKIGGNYSGAEGNIEYCWDQTASEKEGTAVATDPAGNKLFGFSEDDIKKLLEKLKGTEETVKTEAILSLYQQLLRIARALPAPNPKITYLKIVAPF